MHLLDSDTLSYLHGGHAESLHGLLPWTTRRWGRQLSRRSRVLRHRHEFVLKASSGDQLLKAQNWLLASESLLDRTLIVRFDLVAARHFDRLQRDRKLRRIGRTGFADREYCLGQPSNTGNTEPTSFSTNSEPPRHQLGRSVMRIT